MNVGLTIVFGLFIANLIVLECEGDTVASQKPNQIDQQLKADYLSGNTYFTNEEFSKAIPFLSDYLNNVNRQQKTNPTNIQAVLGKLSKSYCYLKDTKNGLPLSIQNYEMCVRLYGITNITTALAGGDLGSAYEDAGEFIKAEHILNYNLSIIKYLTGPTSDETCSVLQSLVYLYNNMQNTSKPRLILRALLDIDEKKPIQYALRYSMDLDGYADLLVEGFELKEAERYYIKSYDVLWKAYGSNYDATISAKEKVALFYSKTGNYKQSIKLLQECMKEITISKKVELFYRPSLLIGLANIYDATGHFQKAHDAYLAAFDGKSASNYLQDRAYAIYYAELAINSFHLHQIEMAKTYASIADKEYDRVLGNTLTNNAGAAILDFVEQLNPNPISIYGTIGDSRGVARSIIKRQGIVFECEKLEDENYFLKQESVSTKGSPQEQIQNLLLNARTDFHHSHNNRKLSSDVDKVNRIEGDINSELTERAHSKGVVDALKNAMNTRVEDVKSILPSDTALVAFTYYDQLNSILQPSGSYGALVLAGRATALKNETKGAPLWIPLANAYTIKKMVKKYDAMMRGSEKGDKALLLNFYDALLSPVVQKLPNTIKRLIIIPDGDLDYLSFAAMMSGPDEFVAEKYSIEYATSIRDLLFSLKNSSHATNTDVIIFSNPAYSTSPAKNQFGSLASSHTNHVDNEKVAFHEIHLSQLSSATKESEFLLRFSQSLKLHPIFYTGVNASESQLKQLHSPYILHLATHGVYISEPYLGLKLRMPFMYSVVPLKPTELNWIAFAGAQNTLNSWLRGETPDTWNDGILMAEEARFLDLKNTWLVTLSACDSGLGDATPGDGVLGLRRGFIQAGAQNILTTLWPISDRLTVDLMEAFYQEALKTKDAPGALASVQRDFLKRLKHEKGPVMAARLAGPFVMNFQGKPGNN